MPLEQFTRDRVKEAVREILAEVAKDFSLAADPAPCNCDLCDEDPAYTCSYTGDDVSIQSVYITNAYRGHLILCPGGENGSIGGLLHQLDPPQHYSHMGIMVTDFDLIRHTTASPSRLVSPEYYTGSILGVSVPADGLTPNHVQYGWPGSITQSAEQVLFADQYGDGLIPPGMTTPYTGSKLVDPESPGKKPYTIAALSFDTVSDDGVTEFPALVVKPCPLLQTPAVARALARVADEAMKIYAHYRFYCYTNGIIGDVSGYESRLTDMPKAQPEWDSANFKWMDWADPSWSDPSKPNWVNVITIPAVCSSFVWQAVQNANKVGSHLTGQGGPKIILDWAKSPNEALGDDGGQCRRTLQPIWSADRIDHYTLDGMYVYDEGSRKIAATWLKKSLSDKIYSDLKNALRGQGGVMKTIADVIDDFGAGAFILAAEGGAAAVVALLTSIGGPLGTIVGSVLSLVLAEQLIELLYDLPNDIANQVCNSFAFDCHRGFPGDTRCVDAAGNPIRDIDSTNWDSHPGVGRAVSPDNIHMFWDAPRHTNSEGQVEGIYGYNEPVQVVKAVVRRPKCFRVKSTGTATIKGYVFLDGKVVAGAYVKVGCQTTISQGIEIGYRFTVRSGGQYKIVARYKDPKTGKYFYGERATGKPGDPPIAPNSIVSGMDIHLIPPPACLRTVTVKGAIRVDDVYFSGADHGDNFFIQPLHVQYGVPKFDENAGTWVIDPNDNSWVKCQTDVAQVSASVDDGDATGILKIEVTAKDSSLSVEVKLTAMLNPGDDNLWTATTVTVPAEATVTVGEISIDSGGPFNDRAYFRGITISNFAGPAI